MPQITAVTVNCGGASPCHDPVGRAAAMTAWARSVVGDQPPALVFAQEVPSETWLEVWRQAGYEVLTAEPLYRSRSAILVGPGSGLTCQRFELPTQGYHGSYVVAARLTGADWAAVVASLHASPSEVTVDWLSRWAGERPQPRQGGGSRPMRLWDSDMVLASVSGLVASGEAVIGAGDLNECLAWDRVHPGESWGRDYFTKAEGLGLRSALHELWGDERPTRFALGQPDYQLDHVLVSRSVSVSEASLDPEWTNPEQVHADQLSDHAPVRFSFRVG